MNSICPMKFFRTTDTTDTTIWKPGLTQSNLACPIRNQTIVSKHFVIDTIITVIDVTKSTHGMASSSKATQSVLSSLSRAGSLSRSFPVYSSSYSIGSRLSCDWRNPGFGS